MVEIFHAMTLSQAIVLQAGMSQSLGSLSKFKNSVLHIRMLHSFLPIHTYSHKHISHTHTHIFTPSHTHSYPHPYTLTHTNSGNHMQMHLHFQPTKQASISDYPAVFSRQVYRIQKTLVFCHWKKMQPVTTDKIFYYFYLIN